MQNVWAEVSGFRSYGYCCKVYTSCKLSAQLFCFYENWFFIIMDRMAGFSYLYFN